MSEEVINIETGEMNTMLQEMAMPYKIFASVPPEDANRRKDAVYRSLKKDFEHPGFRKGNVPRSTMERAIGRENMYRSVLSDIVREAATKEGVDLVAIDKIIVDSIGDDQPIRLSAVIFSMPSVDLPDYKNLTIEAPIEPVLDDDVLDGYMKEMIKNSSLTTRKDVTDEVKDGDLVCIDYEPVMDTVPEGADPNMMSGTDTEFYFRDNGSLRFVKEFEDAVARLKLNETSRHDITFPDNYPQGDLAGKTVSFKFTLKSHKRLHLPSELDAAKEKGFSSFDEWRQDCRNSLQDNMSQRYRSEIDQTIKMRIEGLLLEQSVVSAVPDSLIDQEAMSFLNRIASSEGTNADKYLEEKNITFDDFREDVRGLIDRKIRLQVIFSGIADAEEYSPSESDISTFIENYAKNNDIDVDEAKDAIDPTFISANLKIEKGYDIVRDNVKINYV